MRIMKVYLAGIPSMYEGEDIEIRYSISEDKNLVAKEAVVLEYEKPAMVGPVALKTVLKRLGEWSEREIEIWINDAALYEFVRGTSTTKNKDVMKMVRQIQKELSRFNSITIKDVSTNHKELLEWDEAVQ